jgi:hypothetical protein
VRPELWFCSARASITRFDNCGAGAASGSPGAYPIEGRFSRRYGTAMPPLAPARSINIDRVYLSLNSQTDAFGGVVVDPSSSLGFRSESWPAGRIATNVLPTGSATGANVSASHSPVLHDLECDGHAFNLVGIDLRHSSETQGSIPTPIVLRPVKRAFVERTHE